MSFEEDLKISPFNPIKTNQTATRAPSIGRFAPNFTQILIRTHNDKHFCDNQTDNLAYLYKMLFSTQYAGICHFIIKILLITFLSGGSTDAQIGEIAWEEFEKVGF